MVEEHPAYGQITISRISGDTKLYGSHLPTIGTYMQLRIMRSELDHHLSEDRYRTKERLIIINMSMAQYAQLITNPNTGCGSPCTLRYIKGTDTIPNIEADVEAEHARVQHGFSDSLSGIRAMARRTSERVDALLGKGSRVTKSDKSMLSSFVHALAQEVTDNLEFVVEQFNHSAQRVVTESKAEVDAFITASVTRLGFKRLGELQKALTK